MPPPMPAGPHPPAPPHAATTVLIPLRTGGKSRLRGALDASDRAVLVLAMLDDVLGALRAADLRDIRVLAGDAAAATAASERGLAVVHDPEGADPDRPPGPGDARLRRAVDAGLDAVGVAAVRLVVAADLPLLRAAEVQAVLGSPADVVVVPTRGAGTALLRLAPGIVIPARYGPGSAAAHLAEARERGLHADELDLPGARSDVDGAGDLLALDALDTSAPLPVGPATASFLAARRG